LGKSKKTKKALSPYNRHVQREMKKGKSMKQAAASWSKRAGKPKAATKRKSTAKRSTSKGGNRSMAKRSGFNTQKIFKLVNTVSLVAPAAMRAMGPGTPQQKVAYAISDYTGFDITGGNFKLERLARGWGPYVATKLITAAVPKITSFVKGMF